jgi:hypothetical protein
MQCNMAREHCEKTFKNNIFTSSHTLDDHYLFFSYTFSIKIIKTLNPFQNEFTVCFSNHQFPSFNLGNGTIFLFL